MSCTDHCSVNHSSVFSDTGVICLCIDGPSADRLGNSSHGYGNNNTSINGLTVSNLTGSVTGSYGPLSSSYGPYSFNGSGSLVNAAGKITNVYGQALSGVTRNNLVCVETINVMSKQDRQAFKNASYFIGRTGAICTPQDILKATAAMNSLEEMNSYGRAIMDYVFSKNKTRFVCAAEMITHRCILKDSPHSCFKNDDPVLHFKDAAQEKMLKPFL